jgi:hypothetical protein
MLVDEVNFKIKEMTINEIKELVENTKELTKVVINSLLW